jgi:glycolate oxidase
MISSSGPFNSLEKAGEAVSAIFRAESHQALELMEIDALQITSRFLHGQTIAIPDGVQAH